MTVVIEQFAKAEQFTPGDQCGRPIESGDGSVVCGRILRWDFYTAPHVEPVEYLVNGKFVGFLVIDRKRVNIWLCPEHAV